MDIESGTQVGADGERYATGTQPTVAEPRPSDEAPVVWPVEIWSGDAADSHLPVGGVYDADGVALADGDESLLQLDAAGNLLESLGTLIAGEDITNQVMKVEQRFVATRGTADTLVKSGAGFVHRICLAGNGTITAGVVTIYDNTAESGTAIWSGTVPVGCVPVSIEINTVVANGIYVGYDGTIANVAFACIWR